MDFGFLTAQLGQNARVIQSLVQGVSAEQARWKPGLDDWSILEVANHLADEEIEDFRAHLDVILHHPDRPWPRIDPQAWVTERQYNQRQLGPSLERFLDARTESIGWLAGLAAPDWESMFDAPWGPISAGDVFASWVAHDLLHTRQLVELHYTYAVRLAEPYAADYAGPW